MQTLQGQHGPHASILTHPKTHSRTGDGGHATAHDMKLYKLENFDLVNLVHYQQRWRPSDFARSVRIKGTSKGLGARQTRRVCLGQLLPMVVMSCCFHIFVTSLSLVVHKFGPSRFFHLSGCWLFEVITIQVHPGLRLIGPGTSRSAGVAQSTGTALQVWPGAWSTIDVPFVFRCACHPW